MPARSVEAVVADMRRKACEEVHAEVVSRGLGGVITHGDIQVLTDAALDAVPVPALVEALAWYADPENYSETADGRPYGGRVPIFDDDDCGDRARAALGGEQVQGRAELRLEPDEIAAAQMAATFALSRTDRRMPPAIHRLIRKLDEAAGESSSPTPTTPKGAEHGQTS